MSKLPKAYQRFQEEYPEIARAYDNLGAAVHQAGPLDEKTRVLVKLALAIGAQSEGATHSHAARALELGATEGEIRHVVLLAIPTIGFPRMMAAMTWVDDVLKGKAQ